MVCHSFAMGNIPLLAFDYAAKALRSFSSWSLGRLVAMISLSAAWRRGEHINSSLRNCHRTLELLTYRPHPLTPALETIHRNSEEGKQTCSRTLRSMAVATMREIRRR